MRPLVAAVLLFAGAPASANVGQWEPEIAEASARFAVPAEWIRRVMRAESGGRLLFNGRPVTSRAGAMGLMQIMPGTWAELRARLGLGADPYQPRDNILAGTAYLRMMHDRFGYPGLFAAYNAGPKRYARHLATGTPLPLETQSYVVKIVGTPRETIGTGLGVDPQPKLFVVHAPELPPIKAADAATSGLFAIQR